MENGEGTSMLQMKSLWDNKQHNPLTNIFLKLELGVLHLVFVNLQSQQSHLFMQ